MLRVFVTVVFPSEVISLLANESAGTPPMNAKVTSPFDFCTMLVISFDIVPVVLNGFQLVRDVTLPVPGYVFPAQFAFTSFCVILYWSAMPSL